MPKKEEMESLLVVGGGIVLFFCIGGLAGPLLAPL